jgi:uncharacterized protein (UPF0297 family)
VKPCYAALEKQIAAQTFHFSDRGMRVMSEQFGRPINLLNKGIQRYSEIERVVSYAITGVAFGDPYYISAPIIDMLNTAARTIPQDTIIREELLPTTAGFVWLEKPIYRELDLDDGRGMKMLPCLAISWNVMPIKDYDGKPTGDRMVTFGLYTDWDGVSAPVLTTMYPAKIGDSLESYVHYVDRDVYLTLKRLGRNPYAYNVVVPFILSLLLFMRQRILRAEVESGPDRATARRLAKLKNHDMTTRKVNVIRLRKTDYGKGERPKGVDAVEWSCYWMTRGHWRRQYYPRRDTHETIWIEAYLTRLRDCPR